MTPQQEIIKKFEEKLGNDEFVKASKLIQIGLFGSHAALTRALNDGILPSVQVTAHRRLVPKSAIIEHIRKNVCFKEKI